MNSPFHFYLRKVGLSCALLLLVSACSQSGQSEIKQWMAQTRAQTKPGVPKIAEPQKFEPFTYMGKEQIDPFNAVKLSSALAKLMSRSGNALKPNTERRREPLEAYTLDTMQMVGTLLKQNSKVALVKAEGSLHQVKLGQYIGPNFGQVVKINEQEVQIKEIVQDAAGDWVERKAKLELQESKK